MKNIFFLSFFMVCFLVPKSYGQILFDDFDSYFDGDFDLWWNASEWVGWQGNYSGAVISTTKSFSGTKSLEIINPNDFQQVDIVGLLPTINSNLATISFMQYLETESVIGLIHNYTATGSNNEFSVIIEYDFTSTIYTHGTPVDFFPQRQVWVENRFELNYDIDSAYFYYANQLVTSWKLSRSANNSTPTVNQIDAINIYTPALNGGSAYYDDLRVTQYSVSSKEVENIKELKVFPNPATNELQISLGLVQDEMVQYELTDISGRIVKTWQAATSKEAVTTHDVSELTNGIYILKVTAGQHSKTEKIVISR
jgi:hypothetical protein